ncbi:MAG TPA: M1 family aminopeptidase [Terriglobales bacterium]|nr:M1 family aminopeptidase [Terriglobales bacterium]
MSWCLLAATAWAQAAASPDCPQTTGELYARIRSVGLDPQRVYHVRGASIDRPNLYLDLGDGTLAFTEDICGRITGAFFQGEGEILLRPPNRAERGSLALFTGMAILEEQFTSGYLRFNDDTAAALQRFLSPAPEGAEFIKEWSDTSRTLAEFDALRLLLDFSHFLPASGGNEPDRKFPSLLHAHLLGKKLGGFEVFWDAASAEPLWAGQPRVKDGILFFDIWTSFAPSGAGSAAEGRLASDASITAFRIRASVQPPTKLQASTEVKVRIRSGGERTLLFELSRYLKIDALEADGRPVDFIQNQALEGTQLRRKGNDLVAVVFPAPLAPGQELKLRFRYAGEVLSEAGNGLLYVGERGTWYPNFGLSPAQFEMEFHYPANWTLVATGKQISRAGGQETETNREAGAEKVSRWTSERPIPVAGFNLGKYVRAEAKAGNILVEAYGTKVVEKSFPKAPVEVIEQPTFPGALTPRSRSMEAIVVTPPPPSPARNVHAVADRAAKAIASFSQWFGPYPYGSLALTQMPGELSQGWPGLVFLSSFAFLSPQEQTDLRLDPVTRELASQVLVHETAHQWWGDLVQWRSYRDQWISEGLANYASLLMLEQQNPAQFRQVLEKYRRDLLSKNKDGEWLRDAGPVTLGQRLESSHFPGGYEAISYERGTWLFHMLRSMLRDSEAASRSRKGRANPRANSEEPFFRALRRIRELYAGKSISTQELVQVFEEELPRPLWYEKRPKLDWFLEGWIEGTAMPELEAREIRITEKAGVTTVTGVIVQKDVPDDLVTAVPVYAATAGKALVFLGEVLADGRETGFRLIAPSNVRKIVLDPKQTILTTLK